MWDLGCLQPFYWEFRSSGMWHCDTVSLHTFSKILRDCIAFETMASTNSASHSRRPESSSISVCVNVNVFSLQSIHSPGSAEPVEQLSLTSGVWTVLMRQNDCGYSFPYLLIVGHERDVGSKRRKRGSCSGVNWCLPVIHHSSTNWLLGIKAVPGCWCALSEKAECTVV